MRWEMMSCELTNWNNYLSSNDGFWALRIWTEQFMMLNLVIICFIDCYEFVFDWIVECNQVIRKMIAVSCLR